MTKPKDKLNTEFVDQRASALMRLSQAALKNSVHINAGYWQPGPEQIEAIRVDMRVVTLLYYDALKGWWTVVLDARTAFVFTRRDVEESIRLFKPAEV